MGDDDDVSDKNDNDYILWLKKVMMMMLYG